MPLFDLTQAQSADIRAQILQHPFVSLIHCGTLAEHTFDFYAEQDELYIVDLIPVLLAIAHQLKTKLNMHEASDIISRRADLLRQEVDAGFFNPKRTPTLFQPVSMRTEKIEVIEQYIDHLQKSLQSGSITIALASVISCYVSYRQIGEHARLSPIDPDNRYKSWIEINYDQEFVAFGQTLIDIAEQTAQLELANGALKDINLAARAGVQSYHYEYGLFDASFKGRALLQSTASREYSL